MTLKRIRWDQEAALQPALRLVYSDCHVWTKVRITDVIAIASEKFTFSERKFMLTGHFDFVVADVEDNPLIAFELDGEQHFFNRTQADRDAKKQSICDKEVLPLVRIRFSDFQSVEGSCAILADSTCAGLPESVKEWLADLLLLHVAMRTDAKLAELVRWSINIGHFPHIEHWESCDALVRLAASPGIRLAQYLGLYKKYGYEGMRDIVEASLFERDFLRLRRTKESQRDVAISPDEYLTKIRAMSDLSGKDWEAYGPAAHLAYLLTSAEISTDDVSPFRRDHYYWFVARLRALFTSRLSRIAEGGGTIEDQAALAEAIADFLAGYLETVYRLSSEHPAALDTFLELARSLTSSQETISNMRPDDLEGMYRASTKCQDYVTTTRLMALGMEPLDFDA